MDRRVTLAVIGSIALATAGVGAFVMSKRKSKSDAKMTASCGMPMGDTAAASKLPKGVTPMPAAQQADFTGKAVCGFCSWGIGQDCNTMLYDKDGHHVAAVLPNDKLAELQKLTGT